MPVSKAHIKASNKYNKENYRKIQANIKPADYYIIDNCYKMNNVSKSELIVNACKMYIESKTIN